MPKISLPQKNLVLDAPTGANLMRFLLDHKIPVASSCQGDGICSKCRIQVPGNKWSSSASELEKSTLQRNNCAPDERLSCQIMIEGDLELKTTYW